MSEHKILFASLFGGLFAVVGALIVLLGAGIIPAPPDSIHAARWVLVAFGASFVFGGLFVTTQLLSPEMGHRPPLLPWLQYISTLGFLGTFSAVIVWTGLGPGERRFSGSILFVSGGNIGNLFGRLAFGGFGVLLVIVTLWFAVSEPLRILGLWPWRRNGRNR